MSWYILGPLIVVFCGVLFKVNTKLENLQAEIKENSVKAGVWTEWEEWSSCNDASDDGLRSRSRTCSDPSPSSQRKYCDGESVQYKICSQKLCTDAELISTLEEKLQSKTRYIAFTAYLSATATQLSHRKIIPFDKVILNEGQGFNVNTHIFTCPVSGTYNFQTALLSIANSQVITEIVKEGDMLVQAYAQPPSNVHIQGFNSVFTKCDKGENVWVRIHVHGDSVYSGRFSTFSGYLLWEQQ